MEYGNGIMGDMCVHMLDAVRWQLNLGWPKKIYSTGGIYVQTTGKSNIADTQTATFEFDNLTCVWQHRSWGNTPDPEYPWGYKIYGDKGMLACSPYQYDFTPSGDGKKIHKDATYEREKYPEDTKEKDIEIHAAPATRMQMLNFLTAIEENKKPVADIEEGHISTASCIIANLAMKTGRTLRYDPSTRQVIGDAEATQLLQRTYRGPWIHPLPDKI
jgi:predicted dehydrogenase